MKIKYISSGMFFVGMLVFLAFPAYAQWLDPKTDSMDSGLPKMEITTVIEAFMFWSLEIFGFLAIIAFVISGILYLTTVGDETRLKKARGAMTWSIVGVVVALIGYIVVQAADAWLRGRSDF